MDARPDKEEMEEAIENFLSRLEKQEQRGFKDLKTLLSELPCPQPAAGGLCQSQRPWRLASSPNQTKTWWICSRRQNYDCTVMHKITGTQIEKDIPSYPIIDWVYLSIYVVLAGGLLMNSKM